MAFKQVFRIAFITLIWKQYKAWIISSVLLIISLFLIGKIHADFLHHWELQEDSSQTGQSFIIKWLAYLSSILLYYLYHRFRPKKANIKQKKAKQKALKEELKNLPDNEDPFSSIRAREKLRSRSDFILKNKQEGDAHNKNT